MKLYFLLLYTLMISYLQPRVGISEEQSLHFRTWPHDLDLNFHMNNGSYFISWDEKWVYIEQKFLSRGETVAVAHIKGLIKGKKGPVPTHILLAHMGHTNPPTHPIPKAFQ
jgi:hypothetical protein